MPKLTERILRAVGLLSFAITITMLQGCSSTKHVPDGKYLLDKVNISVVDTSGVSTDGLANYLRQTPNHKILGCWKLQLGVYNLSGKNSTGKFSRWLQKIGQEPIIYDQALTDQSALQLRLALINRGYNDATVAVDTISTGKKKIAVSYRLSPGAPHKVTTFATEYSDSVVREVIATDSIHFPLGVGDNLNRTDLDNIRAAITEGMRERGYLAFTKDYISFIADTVSGSKDVNLTMMVKDPGKRYHYRNVFVVTDFSPGDDASAMQFAANDTVSYEGLKILYGSDRFLRPGVLAEQCYIRPGDTYSTSAVDRTYENFNRLQILRYVNIVTSPVGEDNGEEALDAFILLSRTKKQGVTFELEGTNSEGDLGVGGGVTWTNRNLFHGGEMLTAKVRGAYESLSGDLDGLINDRYTELAGEVGITFPKMKAPFLSSSFKRRNRASTEFALTFMWQERPEYTRIIGGATWRFKWADRNNMTRRTFDLIDLNMVSLPRSTVDFIDNIAPNNPLLRYSYEDHFIMRTGYTWYHTNRRPAASANSLYRLPRQVNTYTWRASIETAGNLLYAVSKITGMKKSDGAYKVFSIPYAQYIKGEIDYTINHAFSDRNSISFHAGGGIGYPYGNASMIPFEKRFYAGGANSVRGWSVRTLGPGSFNAQNSVTDFINQCGDISMMLSLEYRNKLFWVFEGALFIDAGNIWTIKDYPNQEGGKFSFNTFYKEIALAYGLGLRMDFTYFLLRFDLGFKAHNPARDQERWPLIHPNWSRDATFHFSVGYPF
jgi:hypothetical protein